MSTYRSGLITLAAAWLLLPSTPTPKTAARTCIDWLGLLLLTAGLVPLLVPLIQGQDAAWTWWTYLMLAVAVLILAGFARWEIVHTRRGHDPLVPPRLFTHRAFTGGVGLALVYFAAFTSIFFTLSILWQAGLGHSALQTGIVLVPFAVGSIIASSLSDLLSRRLGRAVLMLGALLVTIGLAWTWLILHTADPAGLTHWQLLPPLPLAGVGNGAFIAPNTQFIIATVDRPVVCARRAAESRSLRMIALTNATSISSIPGARRGCGTVMRAATTVTVRKSARV